MSLNVASLNSGSNGNCYYVGNSREAVLIDAGISCRETERRMSRLGLDLSRVKAVFITHEHTDHIYGAMRLAKKHKLPIYITPATLRQSNITPDDLPLFSFRAYEPIRLGQLSVTPFPKQHDAVDPHSFIISNETVRVGVFTDIGVPCEHVVGMFKQCHAVFLEANYDEEMLERGGYPIALKNRIRNGHGHLSNRQALQLFTDHRPPFMTHLFLSHLSRNNNSPALVEPLFAEKAGATKIVVASRFKESTVYHIEDKGNIHPPANTRPRGFSYQLDLFR